MVKTNKTDSLLLFIEAKRRELFNLAQEYTLTSPEVVNISCEIDSLLNIYQKKLTCQKNHTINYYNINNRKKNYS